MHRDLFEPHVQREDLSWPSVEKALTFIEPSLAFWQHTNTLALHDGKKPVSFNVIDVTLNFCNKLGYAERLFSHFQRNLWSELAIRYLKHDNVEQAMADSLASRLVTSETPNESEFETA